MGFGITLGDLSRNKLKKTGKGSEQPKKPDLPAPPPTHETAEKVSMATLLKQFEAVL